MNNSKVQVNVDKQYMQATSLTLINCLEFNLTASHDNIIGYSKSVIEFSVTTK